MEFRFVDDEPQTDFRFVDDEAEDETARLTWAGRPTTMAAVNRAAKENGVSPETILELGTTAGRLESRLAQSGVAGQTVMRAGEGIKQVGETIAASLARVAGREDIASRIHEDRRKREEFLSFIEKGGDAQAILGERGARVLNQTISSVGTVGTSAVLAGPVGVYSFTIGDAWERGLDDAQRSGLDGVDAVGHAGRSAVIEGGLTFLMGRAGKKLGLESLEESMSPAARNAVRKQLANPAAQSSLQKAAVELGGWTAEGAEEMLIAGGQQANEIAAGMRQGFDWDEILDAGASGVVGRGAVGAVKSLKNSLASIEKNLPEINAGTRAAEIDLERGMNPLELLEHLKDPKEFERQTGRSGTTKQQRDSYRDAIEFYVKEARDAGNTSAMERYEADLEALRAEDHERDKRVRESKQRAKAGKSKTASAPVAQQAPLPPPKTADQRAQFSLADFEARALPPLVGTAVSPAPANVNPYIRAPWEAETRQQRRIRTLSRDVAQHKETIKGLRESHKQTKRLREDQLTAARQLVQENIPRKEQWKFLSVIQGAKTPKTTDALLRKISDEIDARDHRLAVMDLKQAFKKATNLRSEFSEQVKQLKDQVDLKTFGDRNAAVKIKLYAEQNPHALLTEKEQEILDRWDKTNVGDMSVDDIRTMSEVVQRLAYDSKVKDRIIGNQQSGLIRDIGDTIAAEAASAPQMAVNEDQERDWASFALLEAAERPEATLTRISPTLNDNIYNKLAIEDQNTYDLSQKEVIESLGGVFNSLGLHFDQGFIKGLLLGEDTRGSTPLEAWRNKRRSLAGVDVSRDELHMVSRWMQDPQARRSVLEAGVELEEGGRVLPPFTPKMLAEMADFLGVEGQAIAAFMFDYDNNTLFHRMNASNETLTGRPLTTNQQVVPMVRSQEEFATFLSSGRSSGYQHALLDSHGTFKHRGDVVAPLKIPKGMGSIDMFMTHADRVNRFAAFAVNARNAEMLLNDSEVKKAIIAKNGQAGWDHIVKAVRSHVVGNKPRSEGERAIALFNAGTAAAKIALSPVVMLQQALDPITAAPWDEGGMRHLMAGYGEINKRGPKALEDEMENEFAPHSGNFWARYKSGDYIGEHTSGQYKTRSYFRPPTLTQGVMHPLTRSEFFAAAMPNYAAAKAAARERFGQAEDDYTTNFDDPAWRDYVRASWDKKTYRGSNSSHGLELSAALRYAKDNPVAGSLLNFYNTASKVYSLWTMGVNKARQGHYTESGAFLTAAITNGLAVAIIQQGMTLSSADEEEPFWKKVLLRLAENTMGLHFGLDNFLGQNVVEPVGRAMLNMKQQGPRFDNPVLVLETAGDMAFHGTKAAIEMTGYFADAYDPEAFSKEFIDATSKFLELRGIPAGQVKDLYRRAWGGLESLGVLPENKMEKEAR